MWLNLALLACRSDPYPHPEHDTATDGETDTTPDSTIDSSTAPADSSTPSDTGGPDTDDTDTHVVDTADTDEPRYISPGPWLAVAAGDWHTCAIDAAYEVQCWGWWAGDEEPPEGEFIALDAGSQYTYALSASGDVYL